MTALVNPFWYAAPAGAPDPNFANVVLLCHFDGADLATTFTDSSLSNHTVTGSATARLTTAQQKFGTASLNISAGSAGASSADSPDWTFGAGQFTVEAFVRPTASISGLSAVAAQLAAGNASWFFGFNAGTLQFYWSNNGASFPSPLSGSYTPTLNTWVHVAVDRNAANLLRIYANGAVIASVTAADVLFNATTALSIGNDGTAGRTFVGQIDELRITKGVARYNGAYTPPAAPFPDS